MIKRKKVVKILTLAAFLTLTAAASVYGATKKAITSVSLSIDADIIPDTDIGWEEIKIDSRSDYYTVDGYMVMNEGNTWKADMVPEIQVTLTAEDNYYFKSIPKSKIGIRGDGTVAKGTIKDSSGTMLLTIQFPSLKTVVPDVEEVNLSDEGIATWKDVVNAGKYEILFCKNGVSSVTPVTTNTNSYNCRERLGKGNAGASYSIKVRAVNENDEKNHGRWTKSNSIFVSGEDAKRFRKYPHGGTGSWKKTEDGRYWYERADGTYPANGWEELSGLWYFFDGDGYMQTGWIHWNGTYYYCLENGQMLKDADTPDGYHVGSDGAMIVKNTEPEKKEEKEEDPDETMQKEWDKLQGNTSDNDED